MSTQKQNESLVSADFLKKYKHLQGQCDLLDSRVVEFHNFIMGLHDYMIDSQGHDDSVIVQEIYKKLNDYLCRGELDKAV